jgi:arsenite methyltransferase
VDSGKIKNHVKKYYHALYAQGRMSPKGLPVISGKTLAERLDYPRNLLDSIPDHYWDLFAACGNLLKFAPAQAGERVLNLGCGVGIDSLALATGRNNSVRVVGMDVVRAVLVKARELAFALDLPQETVSLVCGDGEWLPFASQSFHRVCMNGVFNLFANKSKILREIYQVLQPAGQVLIADLCAGSTLPRYFDDELDAWAWCMSGALTEDAIGALLSDTGFEDVEVSQEETGDMFHRIVFSCRRPP